MKFDKDGIKALNFINKIKHGKILCEIFKMKIVWIDDIPHMIPVDSKIETNKTKSRLKLKKQ